MAADPFILELANVHHESTSWNKIIKHNLSCLIPRPWQSVTRTFGFGKHGVLILCKCPWSESTLMNAWFLKKKKKKEADSEMSNKLIQTAVWKSVIASEWFWFNLSRVAQTRLETTQTTCGMNWSGMRFVFRNFSFYRSRASCLASNPWQQKLLEIYYLSL